MKIKLLEPFGVFDTGSVITTNYQRMEMLVHAGKAEYTEEDYKVLYYTGEAQKKPEKKSATRDELRELCRNLGLPTSGSKKDLQARIAKAKNQ